MAISVVLGLNQMFEKRESFQTDPRLEVWLVSQVELEHLRLIGALDLYHEASEANLGVEATADVDKFLSRMEIFSGHLLALSQGGEAKHLRDVEGLGQTIDHVIATLETIEPEIADLPLDDGSVYRSVRAALSALGEPIHTMVRNTTNHERELRLEYASARSDIFWQVIGYFAGILVSGTVLILFLIWQNRETKTLLGRAGEAEARANDASSHLMFAIESFTDGFALFDQEGKLQICNARYLAIFPKTADIATPGRTVEELAREALLRGQLWDTGAGVEDRVDEHLRLFALDESFEELRLNDGRWIHVKSRKTADGFNAVVYSDVTHMKQREAELAQNSTRLEIALEKEVELSSMKSNFVATASHEFRTPLTTIFSAADLLHHYGHHMDDAKKGAYLDEIKQEVGEMTRLLDDILLVRKLEAGIFSFNPEESDLGALLRNLVRASQYLAGKNKSVSLNIECDSSTAMIDNSLMRHIVNNLLSNAIKYSPDGKSVSVTLARLNGDLILDIADQGIGIPEADIDRVFETFFRAENSAGFGGTGLGLSVVKTAVELHGGKISVDSAVNEGTVFTVRIPDRSA
ncbi:MAG: hypothetical protein HOJ07_00775 [Rhodospirillaceae bacterium]|nr:hypothetical protein [Rhodospirillaceae bacterium]